MPERPEPSEIPYRLPAQLRRVWEELDPRQRLVVMFRLGIGGPRRTLREAADHIGISKEYARNLEHGALHDLLKAAGGSGVRVPRGKPAVRRAVARAVLAAGRSPAAWVLSRDRVVAQWEALEDPVRVHIIAVLLGRDGSLEARELAQELGVGLPIITRHLGFLVRVDAVLTIGTYRPGPNGSRVRFRLSDEFVSVLKTAHPDFDRLAECTPLSGAGERAEA